MKTSRGLKSACLVAGVVAGWGELCFTQQADAYVPPGNPINIHFEGSVTPVKRLTKVHFLYTSNASFGQDYYPNLAAPLGDMEAGVASPFLADYVTRDEFLSLGDTGYVSLIGLYETGDPSRPNGIALGMNPTVAQSIIGSLDWSDIFGDTESSVLDYFEQMNKFELQDQLAGFLSGARWSAQFPGTNYTSDDAFVKINPLVFEGSPKPTPEVSFDFDIVYFSVASEGGSVSVVASSTPYVSPTPEPGTFLLAAAGMGSLAFVRRRRA